MTGYGENGTGDANDEWTVVVPGANPGSRIARIETVITLVHGANALSPLCALHSHGKNLPKWGHEQVDGVVCVRERDGRCE